MKAVIFDSGTLINLSMNGLLYIIEEMKKSFNGKFLITADVKYETIDRPAKIERFELGALQIQNLLEKGIIEMPEVLNIGNKKIAEDTKKLVDIANHLLMAEGRWINIVGNAEMSCLALSSELTERGMENIIAIDERTTRMLSEAPENLGKLMSEKLRQRVNVATENFNIFEKYRFIRSSELVYAAYKKGIIKLQGKNVLEALLYATKFKGSSISFDEINVLKKL